MDIWDDYLMESGLEDKINAMFDTHGFILFFKKGKDHYGAGEESRVIFARMKNPDKEIPDNWEEEANFSAYNLAKLLSGNQEMCMFDHKDLKKIKVVDREDAVEFLKDHKPEEKSEPQNIFVIKNGSKESPNFIRADEE